MFIRYKIDDWSILLTWLDELNILQLLIFNSHEFILISLTYALASILRILIACITWPRLLRYLRYTYLLAHFHLLNLLPNLPPTVRMDWKVAYPVPHALPNSSTHFTYSYQPHLATSHDPTHSIHFHHISHAARVTHQQNSTPPYTFLRTLTLH